jgi:hypothetical protein
MHTRASLTGNRKGQVLYIVAGSLVMMLGMSALAIDVGLLFLAKTEAQRVADAAALAGAGTLLANPLTPEAARAAAIDWASRNQVRGTDAEVLPMDVDVIADSQKVRVRVFRTLDRGNAVQTLFARVLGFDQVNVSAVAAAQAYPAGGVTCIMPFAVPDRWSETSGTPYQWPTNLDRYEGSADDDLYIPWGEATLGAPSTGYSPQDRGTRILIKTQDPQGAFQPGWFYPIRLPGDAGGDIYRIRIGECGDPTEVFSLEDLVVGAEPGNMVGPTRRGFQALYDQDPGAYWDDTCQCVLGSAFAVSPRIRPMGLFDPRFPPPSGAHSFRIRNFIGVFVEAPVAGSNEFWVRFVEYVGVSPADVWSPNDGPLARVLRLVE